MAPSSFALDNLFSVRGRHVLITGAGTGLGQYMAKGFAANGAVVYMVARRASALAEARAAVEAVADPEAVIHTAVLDVTDRGAVTAFIGTLPRLDVLINNAGICLPDARSAHTDSLPALQAALLSSPAENWAATFATNVEAPYFLSASALHLLAASPQGGRVINISSIGALNSDPRSHQPAYQASKAAVTHLTRLLASKFREVGVRVTAIVPGLFPSQMQDPNDGRSQLSKAREIVPLRRGGEEEDIAGTAIYLASRAGSYVDGDVIVLGGGRNWAGPEVHAPAP
ncbi:hypothetical protein Q8F55_006729 [Vanrija albida]|uniref:Uncharacterized protein n=1 Tax=Vanrija albida TaxID=181172 RepID=A0ABR3PY05_9TREE